MAPSTPNNEHGALVADRERHPVRAVAQGAPLRHVFVVDAADADGAWSGWPKRTPFAELLKCVDRPPAVPIEPSRDTLVIPYSSGTSGLPKGVVLTHRNVVANLRQISASRSLNAISSDDVVLGVLPFYHIYGAAPVRPRPSAPRGASAASRASATRESGLA